MLNRKLRIKLFLLNESLEKKLTSMLNNKESYYLIYFACLHTSTKIKNSNNELNVNFFFINSNISEILHA